MGIKPQTDDWIVGFDEKRRGHNLLYAMKVDEVLHFASYHADKRFKSKIPRYTDDWRDLCGDNLYFQVASGEWDRVDSPFHVEPELFEKDIRHPYVLIADHFYYFGGEAVTTPRRFQSLVHARRGCKSTHDPSTVNRFVDWLENTFEPGMLAEPRDAAEVQELRHSDAKTACDRSPAKCSH